jgi:hypothetical protein
LFQYDYPNGVCPASILPTIAHQDRAEIAAPAICRLTEQMPAWL